VRMRLASSSSPLQVVAEAAIVADSDAVRSVAALVVVAEKCAVETSKLATSARVTAALGVAEETEFVEKTSEIQRLG